MRESEDRSQKSEERDKTSDFGLRSSDSELWTSNKITE